MAHPIFAQRSEGMLDELKRLSLDELVELQVSTVSRREERAVEAAAAVHVITEEDLRRSGASSLPEALRLAPNLQVARSDARNWAISARGFNATFSNKLLVLIDDRSVYTPLYAGVFWDVQDVLLEDVARIEVISGPGATVWGANAVNGVINVISKPARETQGSLVTVGGGNEERLFGAVRQGAAIRDDLHFRVYAKAFSRDDARTRNGGVEPDAWQSAQAGFRADWEPDDARMLTVQGDLYDGEGDQTRPGDVTHSGGNLLARWSYRRSEDEQFRIHGYFDRTDRLVPGDFGDKLDTYDIDGQYEWSPADQHQVMVGAGYRFTRNRVINFASSAFLPERLDRSLYSAFVQDEIAVPERNLKTALGVKLEHNEYTGLEIQPSARVAWLPGKHTVWAAVSRAVRTPSRFDRHLYAPARPPFVINGGPATVSEKLIAYEIGWRTQLREELLVSATAFLHDYDDIRTLSFGPPFMFENNGTGEIAGLEMESTWQVTANWRITAGYTFLEEDLRVKPGRRDLSDGQGEAFDPRHRIQLRSSLDLSPGIEFDVWLRYTDQVGNTSARGFGVVPSYLALDVRLGWSPTRSLEVALVGKDLLDPEHPEFGGQQIDRSIYGQVTWRY